MRAIVDGAIEEVDAGPDPAKQLTAPSIVKVPVAISFTRK
jgi:hypothetical protein